jgi:hypothetical protein
MTKMEYTEPREVEYGYEDEKGRAVFGFKTEPVDCGTTFGAAVNNLILRETGRTYGNPKILMTTREHWSGYSDMTITNQWSEIILTVPDWNTEREWPSLGDFLRAMADANPQADR